MFNIVVPVGAPAFLLPRCQLARVDTSEVAHVDVEAELMGQVGSAVLAAMDHPCLRGVENAVHEKDDIQSVTISNPIKVNDVAILSFTLVARVLVAYTFNQVTYRPRVNVLSHQSKGPLNASYEPLPCILQGTGH